MTLASIAAVCRGGCLPCAASHSSCQMCARWGCTAGCSTARMADTTPHTATSSRCLCSLDPARQFCFTLIQGGISALFPLPAALPLRGGGGCLLFSQGGEVCGKHMCDNAVMANIAFQTFITCCHPSDYCTPSDNALTQSQMLFKPMTQTSDQKSQSIQACGQVCNRL